MQRIGRGWFEVEVPVEGFCLIVFGVNQDCPRADLDGRRSYSLQSIFQESGTKPLAPLREIYGQSGKQDHRDGVAGEAFLNPLRNLLGFYASRSQCVVADHPPGPMRNVDSRRAGLMILECMATQPLR